MKTRNITNIVLIMADGESMSIESLSYKQRGLYAMYGKIKRAIKDAGITVVYPVTMSYDTRGLNGAPRRPTIKILKQLLD